MQALGMQFAFKNACTYACMHAMVPPHERICSYAPGMEMVEMVDCKCLGFHTFLCVLVLPEIEGSHNSSHFPYTVRSTKRVDNAVFQSLDISHIHILHCQGYFCSYIGDCLQINTT